MYASRGTQFIVGLFGLLGIGALVVLSVRLGNISILPQPGYVVYADFDDIGGLKSGDDVDIAGVQIGKVQTASLLNNRAHVALWINQGVAIDADAIAAVMSSGIIGGKYVSIALGPSERILHSGDTIVQTQSAFSLENAIGQFINNIGQHPDNSGGGSDSSDKDHQGGKQK
ncbi:MAG: MlaD family protein [Candidatus Binataceae bacterium]